MQDVLWEKKAAEPVLPLSGFAEGKPKAVPAQFILVDHRWNPRFQPDRPAHLCLQPTLGVRKAILQVSDLSIRRGNTVILENVSWRIDRGQHWAMLGANGSGKTSLLSALTGYLNATSGEIELLEIGRAHV